MKFLDPIVVGAKIGKDTVSAYKTERTFRLWRCAHMEFDMNMAV